MRLLVLPLLAALGCASSGAVDAALHGDLTTLRRRLADERRAGDLDRERAKDIARAVAEREVHAGTGRDAARRIRALRACSKPLLGVLEERAEKLDEGGAEATLTLLAAGRARRARLVDRFHDADSGAWRAVAARSTTSTAEFRLRRAYYVDPDERVRRAALEAASEAPTALDLEPLLEAARLDPDPMNQSLAARGVGAIGGKLAVRALGDLWERAEEDLRLAIIEAWSMPRAFEAGGRAALLRQAETGQGVPAVAAAGRLLHVDPSSRSSAVTLLSHAVAEGSADEQRLAMNLLPLEPKESAAALRNAAGDADPGVRVAALERLLEVASERARALRSLREMAKASGPGQQAARSALARARDSSVAPALRAELASRDAARRGAAARDLVALGDYTNAAALLGDGSADVRIATACGILSGD